MAVLATLPRNAAEQVEIITITLTLSWVKRFNAVVLTMDIIRLNVIESYNKLFVFLDTQLFWQWQ